VAATEAMKQTEQIAFAATQGLYDPKKQDFVSDGKPQLEFASRLVNSQEYNRLRVSLVKEVDNLVSKTEMRTRIQVDSAGNALQYWIYLTLASMVLTIVLVVLALQVIWGRVLRPIETLSKAASRMADGDYSTRTKIASGGENPEIPYSTSVRSAGAELAVDELLALGTTFDGMAESIEQDITLRQMAQQELEAAHHMVNSSIQYAARIQRAILPPEEYFRGMVPDHFVLWEPRDVVGGDIYWCKSWGEGCLVVLGDCTGHGVPGAFMTMLSSGALDRAIRDVSPGKVAELIQHMHRILQHTLNQDSQHGQSDDGIEMGVCYLNADRSKMIFAGARFDLYVLENGVVNIIKGSKSGMGYRGIPYDQQFESQQITTGHNMTFYMASDGVVDQVGGETGWGAGRKRLINWMVEAGQLPLAEQKSHIFNQFLAYQGNAKRRDDVSVIGFRV
jgi:serine phosphatase RsbU (regulator of sigma subunit)